MGGGPIALIPLLAIIGIGMVVVVGALIWSISRNRDRYAQPGQNLHPSREAHLRPLLKSRVDLEDLVKRYANNPNVKIIGGEALAEMDALIRHAEEVLQADVSSHRAEIQSQLSEARAEVEALVKDLQATAVKSETEEASSALRESLSRIKSLSSSLEEAETLTDRNL